MPESVDEAEALLFYCFPAEFDICESVGQDGDDPFGMGSIGVWYDIQRRAPSPMTEASKRTRIFWL